MKRVTVADETVLRQARTLVPVLYQLSRVLRMQGTDESGLGQLPPSELEVLRYVADTPGVSVSTLARDLGLHASNVSATVRALVARDLLRREPDPNDRRAVRLHATVDAAHGSARIEDAWARLFAAALAEITDEQRAELADAAPALGALAERLRIRRATERS
ncbi:MarR family transcriptional regulator [Micromonospora sp. WMMD1102]|uniref:MarR family winged helix-turn-helix transcriptional regulator n=1 Tax=Micromonospora sp. WMMD1102 TaxID=3016105 RepID=UPI002414F3AC|nr:MarR family transcriptional regulator [Micromonospora sp. WMMD1102]MDG4790990.1 MarR family transcriptional regulator [Micromonospora sp. WMMD1102]